jgi:hypothetical protein
MPGDFKRTIYKKMEWDIIYWHRKNHLQIYKIVPRLGSLSCLVPRLADLSFVIFPKVIFSQSATNAKTFRSKTKEAK